MDNYVLREIHSKIDWAKMHNYALFVTPDIGDSGYGTKYGQKGVNIDPSQG